MSNSIRIVHELEVVGCLVKINEELLFKAESEGEASSWCRVCSSVL